MSETQPSAGEGALRRELGLTSAIGMGLGSILGTGVFVSLGIAAGVAGPGLLLAVVLAAFIAIANGLSSATLAAGHPVSGGTYEYGYRVLHPAAGFAAGWLFLAAKAASAATAAIGCAAYVLYLLPGAAAPLAADTPVWTIGLAVAIVIGLTLLVAGGVRRSSWVNIAIVMMTIGSLLLFIISGWASGSIASGTTLSQRIGWDGLQAALAEPGALFHATALVFVAYTGYGRIATLGEEVRDPARTIPRAILLTLGLTMLLYLSVAVTALAVVGPAAFAGLTEEAGAPLEGVARVIGGPGLAWPIAIGAVTAMLGVLLNLLLGLSRVVLAMARRHDVPPGLAAIHEGSSSPVRAVWLVGLMIAGLALIGDIRVTWSVSAFAVLLYYGITNAAAWRLIGWRPRAIIPIAGLASCVGLALFIEWQIALPALSVLLLGYAVRLASRRFAPATQ